MTKRGRTVLRKHRTAQRCRLRESLRRDRDRFYVSHMKKVVEWYNALLKYASFDFVDLDAETEEAEQE